MHPKEFTTTQQHALLDLAMLAMYADGHLASAEDARVHRLLEMLGHGTEYDRNQQYDAAVSSVVSRGSARNDGCEHTRRGPPSNGCVR